MRRLPKKRMTRRTFIRGAVAAASAPFIVPSTVFGVDAPSNRIVLGGIGMGGQGRSDLGGMIGQSDVQGVAVCDVDRRNAGSAKGMIDRRNRNSDCKMYSDFREILARKDIDAVVIGTPDHWHTPIGYAAVEAGKDVYCEKPMAHDLPEGRAVADAVRRRGRIWQTGSQQRSSGEFRKACELVRNGYIGKVHHIEVGLPNGSQKLFASHFPEPPASVDYDFYVGPAPWVPYHPKRLHWNWRWWTGFGGGQLMDWIGHHADIGHMGMGYDETGPVSVEGEIWRVPEDSNIYDGPYDYRFTCTYADGVTMTVTSAGQASGKFREVGGGQGTIFYGENDRFVWVNRGKFKSNPPELAKATLTANDFTFGKTRGHIRDFLDGVKSRQLTIAHAEVGHRSSSIGQLGTIACKLGRKLKWDPDRERFIGDDAANGMLGRACRGEWRL